MDPGTRVEVRSRFEAQWARGFEVAEIVESGRGTGFRVRRRSDGSVLPTLFHQEDVREEHRKKSLWWV